MRFSSRLPWDAAINRVWRALEERRKAGKPLLDLTQSNPTRAGFLYPEALRTALADRGVLLYDPVPAGSHVTREAVAGWYAERGYKVDPDHIVVASGTSEAYAWLFKLLCDPGDEILTPRPSYPLFDLLAGLEAVRIRHYSLRYDSRWSVDWETLNETAGARTRAVVVVQPNNPTGSFLFVEELGRLAEFCLAREVAIISDEVFADYPLEEACVPSLCDQDRAPCFVLGGLSKAAGLPQMKLSWIVLAGPATWREEALKRLELIADTYLSVGAPVQCALPALLEAGKSLRDQIHRRVRENYYWLRSRCGEDSAVTVLRAEAGWYAVLRVPRVRSEEQWCLDLLDRGVFVQPGYFYDFTGEAYLVVSLLTPLEELAEGIERLLDLAAV